MNYKNYKHLLHLFISVLIAYLLHKAGIYFLDIDTSRYKYSIETIYLLFLVMSIGLMLVLFKVKKSNIDNVGMSFLAGTGVKLGFYYLILSPILKVTDHNNIIEKRNFFLIFLVFLLIETYITIRMVNEKS